VHMSSFSESCALGVSYKYNTLFYVSTDIYKNPNMLSFLVT